LTQLPPYTIKVNPRARSIRLNLSLDRGLVITIPRSYDARQVPALVREKLPWIEKNMLKLEQERAKRPPQPAIPEMIDLPAVREQWKIKTVKASGSWLRMKIDMPSTLTLTGPVDEPKLVHQLLSRWLHDRAQIVLGEHLLELSRKMGMHYSRLTIRDQRTRWGSCSTTGTISLNQRLLFVPEHLMTYVLVHELCHTVVHSHSPEFWALVSQYVPDHKKCRAELRKVAATLPDFWLND
jgi:predicted metal-dependent hydrolase